MFVVNVEGAIEKDGRYLMIVRGPNVAHAPGALSFPGGKVEPDDGPADALESTLRREIREEVGVEIGDQVTYVDSRRFDTDDGMQALNVTFLCRYRSGTPSADPGEVESVRWMTPEQILRNAPSWFRPAKMQRIKAVRLREHSRAASHGPRPVRPE
jgi:8-oxo-dGTP pyrophosphatase MutT (NUDIX family)